MKKTITVLIAIIAVLLLTSISAFASIDVTQRYVDGRPYNANTALAFSVGQTIKVDLELSALANVTQDIEASLRLVGYRYADRERLRTYDVVVIDGMTENTSKWVTLQVDAPVHVERGEIFELFVDVRTRNQHILSDSITLQLQGERNHIDITRVSFDPEEVVAGRALRTRVRMENVGRTDERDVHVIVQIPELGLRATADISDRFNRNDFVTSEDVLLRIPECTAAGTYDVDVRVEYDRGYGVTTETREITVLADDCPDTTAESQRTVITAPPQGQQITAGAGATSFPVVIKNEGSEDRVYQVSVSGVSGWGSAEVTNPTPLVRAGKSEVVQVYVSAFDNAPAGNQAFTVRVSDSVDARDIPVSVSVAEQQRDVWGTLRTVLLVGVIVLLILVIILGLLVGFNKVRSDNEKDYY